MGIAAYFRLVRAGYVLAREGALSVVDPEALPPALRPAVAAARLIERPAVKRTGHVERLTRALNRLGPTYVKFGQTLATRPDIVGPEIARDLRASLATHEFPSLHAALAAISGIMKRYRAGLLFSPGCASFDEFCDYQDRGRFFQATVAPFCDKTT